MLDWHRDYYSTRPRLATQRLEYGTDGFLRVKSTERKTILLNCIHGIDIDPQAVEVTKLSLLLKVIEGQGQMELDIGRILPDLNSNIACGNSLVGLDFTMPAHLRPEEELQFNPFDWTQQWPGIMNRGGFDAVIGNPPYLNIDNVWGQGDPRLSYIKDAYGPIYSDKTDILFYFIKKAADICRGEIGYIVSRSFLEADKAKNLREWMAANLRMREVLDFRHAKVFPKVGINTAIIRMTRSKAVKKTNFRRWLDPELPPGYTAASIADRTRTSVLDVPVTSLGRRAWNFGDDVVESLLSKIDSGGTPVGEVLHVGQGMQTGANTAFVVALGQERYRELHGQGLAYERARNSDIRSYKIESSGVMMIFPNAVRRFDLLPQDLQAHIECSREKLMDRAAYRRGNCEWWQYTWPLHREFFDRPRIFCPYRAATNRFAIDQDRAFIGITDTTVLYARDQAEDLRFIVGVLNSRLASFRFAFLGKLLGGGVFEYVTGQPWSH